MPQKGKRTTRPHLESERDAAQARPWQDDAMQSDPLAKFLAWYDDALAAKVPMPEAMVLATSTRDGVPSARVVLFRGISQGGLRFFTNYESRKGRELEENPRAALVFHWEPMQRQVRVEGTVERLSDEESDAYFDARPHGHRLGAWASAQSRPIRHRDELVAEQQRAAERFGEKVPRPPYWGGYRVVPHAFEFWTGLPDRLHERVVYRRGDHGWDQLLLSP